MVDFYQDKVVCKMPIIDKPSKFIRANALQLQQARRMFVAGFTRGEIKYQLLIGEKGGGETLQKMFDNTDFARAYEKELFNRSRWAKRQLDRGVTRKEIRETLIRDEKKDLINPFSFLKEEYQKGQRPKSDFQDYLQESEKAKLNEWSKKHFGTVYKR